MRLSVVIPCLNAESTLGLQLDALANQSWTGSWEVVVADNGSTDSSLEVAESYREQLPNVRVVDASDRRGQAYARNVGAAEASGDALLFCDADDEVHEDWLGALGGALEQHDFVACRIDLAKLNSERIWQGRANPQGEGLQDYVYPPFLQHAGGGTLGIKRSLHQRIGGFDEDMSLLEDTDYCWRLQLAGTQLVYVPEATVHVRLRPTLDGVFQQARDYGRFNVMIYKRYREHGMPRLSWWRGITKWGVQLATVPRLLTGSRSQWISGLGWRWGRLEGSFAYRVFAL